MRHLTFVDGRERAQEGGSSDVRVAADLFLCGWGRHDRGVDVEALGQGRPYADDHSQDSDHNGDVCAHEQNAQHHTEIGQHRSESTPTRHSRQMTADR
jgi:hypothetical protein